jgi:hypothetical protein
LLTWQERLKWPSSSFYKELDFSSNLMSVEETGSTLPALAAAECQAEVVKFLWDSGAQR